MLKELLLGSFRFEGLSGPLRATLVLFVLPLALAAPQAAAQSQNTGGDVASLAAELGLSDEQLGKTLGQLSAEYRGDAPSHATALRQLSQKSSALATEAPKLLAAAEEALTQKTVKANTTVAPEVSFADRVSGSLEDFLPFLQFAVQGVSTTDDGESVVVKFNPVKTDYGAIAVKATIGEPEIAPQLLAAIVEPARPAQEKALLSEVDDFGDVVVTGTFGYHRSDRGDRSDLAAKGRLWGRIPSLYDNLHESLFNAVVRAPIDATKAAIESAQRTHNDTALALFEGLLGVPQDQIHDLVATMTLRDLLEKVSATGDPTAADTVEAHLAAMKAHAEALGSLDAARADQPKAEDIPDLIANQPQLVANFSLHERNRFVGPDSYSVSVQWEIGSRNLNAVRKEYRQLLAERRIKSGHEPTEEDLSRAKVDALAEVVSGGEFRNQSRFIFAASWERTDDYSLTRPYQQVVTDPTTGTESTFDREAMVALEGTEEITAKLQWTRLVSFEGAKPGDDPTDPKPRFTFTVEYTDREAPEVMAMEGMEAMMAAMPPVRDRLVANVEYAMPVAGGATIPVTLTYANHARFLGDQDDKLSAHVGLSYKLGGLKKALAGMNGGS